MQLRSYKNSTNKQSKTIKVIKLLPLGIIVLDVNGLVTVIDVCAMVLDGNAVICVLPKASTKSDKRKKKREKIRKKKRICDVSRMGRYQFNSNWKRLHGGGGGFAEYRPRTGLSIDIAWTASRTKTAQAQTHG